MVAFLFLAIIPTSPSNALTIDSGFRGSSGATITSLVMLPDGKFLVGGSFLSIAGIGRRRIARLNRDGSVDPGFSPNLTQDSSFSGDVWAIAIQDDGKILVGGELVGVGGVHRSRIARLNPDGSLDLDFDPSADGTVYDLAVQPDGKIIVAGSFTSIGGETRNRLARLNPDGTVDPEFDPGADGAILCMALQLDGKILVGGSFSTCGGEARANIARINADGTLDETFDPGAGNSVHCLAVQPDEKILVGGAFMNLGGISRHRIGRLNGNGTIDTGFSPGAQNTVLTFALQADGKILAGGSFTQIGGAQRNRVALLDSNGVVDPEFSVGSIDSFVRSIAIPQDGGILLTGDFYAVNGRVQGGLVRLLNPAASSSELLVHGSDQVDWVLSGAAFQPHRVEIAIWSGSSWSGATDAVPVAGGWRASGLSIPSGTVVRARGHVGPGRGSSGFVEQFATYGDPEIPVLEVRLNGGEPIERGIEIMDFDLFFGEETEVSHTVTVTNAGSSELSGLAMQLGGQGEPHFALDALSSTTLSPGASLSVPVTFAPQIEGEYVGALSIFGIAPFGVPFDFYLRGVQSRADPGFSPHVVGSSMYSIAVQSDGRIVAGGGFDTVNGEGRSRIARLDPDGTLDPDFDPGAIGWDSGGRVTSVVALPDGAVFAGGYFSGLGEQPVAALGRIDADGTVGAPLGLDYSGPVECLAMQPDGKVLAGGRFQMDGTSVHLVRVNADGTVDDDFAPLPDILGLYASVLCLAVQADGKILVGGSAVGSLGHAIVNLLRVNPDGSLDSTFQPAIDDAVTAVAVQSDGKILVGGTFTSVGGVARNRIARLNEDGTLDPTFDPASNGTVRTIAIQSDGKILVGGAFSFIGSDRRPGMALLNPDGSLVPDFAPPVSSLQSLTLQIDGRILAGGGFSRISGRPRTRIARLLNDPAFSELSAAGSDQIDWVRGGSAPEVLSAEFQVWDGDGWTDSQPAFRVPGGWRATELTWPAARWVRARGFGATNHGSSGLVEQVVGEGIVATRQAGETTRTTATLRGELLADGGAEILDLGIVFGKAPDVTLSDGAVLAATVESGPFSVEAAGLDEDSLYYARAYATGAIGTGYGHPIPFSTAKKIVFEQGISSLERTLLPGMSRRFHFSIGTPTLASFAIEGSGGLRAVLRKGDGSEILAADADPGFFDQELLFAGDYVLEITGLEEAGEPEDFQLSIDASVEAFTRPDIAVGPSRVRLRGRGIYRPRAQIAPIPSRMARRVVGFLLVENDGLLPDTIAVRGRRGNPAFRVLYSGQGRNLTGALVSGRFSTPELSAGDGEILISATIIPNRRRLTIRRAPRQILRRANFAIPVSASSNSDPRISDAGTIKVLVR